MHVGQQQTIERRAGGDSLSAPEAREFADRWLAAWNGRRPDHVLALCTEDVLWQDPLTQRTEQGRDSVKRYLDSLWETFPDLEMSWREEPFLSPAGPRLVFRWRMTGTMMGPLEPQGFAPTRRPLDAEGIDVFELRGGLVRSYQGFFDARGMAQQIGLLPGTGSAAERVAVAAQRVTARIDRRRR
jgi:steroid delta-isomerase-like uncharacterized protein